MLAAACLAWLGACGEARPDTLLITGALVVDGTGEPGRESAVRIQGDRIVGVGDLRSARRERVLDADGLVLAPGFIDTHSHHDRGIFDAPDALAAVSQGITTIVVGQDGSSALPLGEFFHRLEQEPAAVNVASFIGHNTIRRRIMGDDFRRPASPAEVDRMAVHVAHGMEDGALGLSTGLEYDPGIYAETEEIVALARIAAERGGRYISHIRSEDRELWAALREALDIGREAGIPVQIAHAKLAMRRLWGEADRFLEVMDSARAAGIDATLDVYPYIFWQSTVTVLFPDRDFGNRTTASFVLRELVAPDGLFFAHFEPAPDYEGMTLLEVAQERGSNPVTTLMALIREAESMRARTGRAAESVIGTSMDELDVETLMAWPHANIATDGALAGRHPRGFGTFPRVLGRFVRDRRVLTLEEAVRKSTTLAATNVGLRDRGKIRVGAFADLVLFDPDRILDRATPEDPHALAEGVHKVWVNGELVYDDGRATGRRPGHVLRRVPPDG